jgi:hypothetical protein
MNVEHLDIKKYKRFFAFGDSFTNYYWPTWADIVAQEIEYYENWGLKGSGNHYIFNSVIECNTRNKFTKDDIVIIMWTGCTREDRYVDGQWLTAATEYRKELYGIEWVMKFGTDTRGLLIRDLAYINSIQSLLDSTGCDWINMQSIPITRERNDVTELYKDTLSKIKPDWMDEFKPEIRPNFEDIHPTPNETLPYLRKYLNFIPINNDFTNYWENQVWKIKEKNVLPVKFTRPIVNRF